MGNPTNWQRLGEVAPGALTDAKLQTHWAAQLLTAAADAYAEPADDDSHTNLRWVGSRGALVGRPLGSADGPCLALRIRDLTVQLLDPTLAPLEEISLDRTDLTSARARLSRTLSAHLGRVGVKTIALREYAMPEHPVGKGADFDLSKEPAFAELGRWYANSAQALGALVEKTEGASPPRCWPHHFDIATLITVESAKNDGFAKTIGVGMTPGDGSYAEPYWYVTPYPYPETTTLQPLADGGRWHREGWFGAVLTASELLKGAPDAQAQRDRTETFIGGAASACRELLAAA